MSGRNKHIRHRTRVTVTNTDADVRSLLVSHRLHRRNILVPRERLALHTSPRILFSAACVQRNVQCFLSLMLAFERARVAGQEVRGVRLPLGASAEPLRRGSSAAARVGCGGRRPPFRVRLIYDPRSRLAADGPQRRARRCQRARPW